MRRFLCSSLFAAALLSLPGGAWAADTLGSRVVADNSDSDTILVAGTKKYSSIRLCVSERTVDFHDLDINFGNGGHQDVALREMINPGECTRWIDLEGGKRNITTIVMKYDTQGNSGKQAVVTAYAR